MGGMLLVILGAGASFDSAEEAGIEPGRRSEIHEWRPPLAKDLFVPRNHLGSVLQRYGDYCAGLIGELRAAPADQPLEQLLDEVSARANDRQDSRAATELMAIRYYIRDFIEACSDSWLTMTRHITNYHYLVNRLDRWAREADEQVLYVTFNYDTLLEHACRQAQLFITDFNSYIAHPRIKVFKPHGSVDWAHHVNFDIVPDVNERDYVIQNASTLNIPLVFEKRTDWRAGIRGQEWVPALAVPVYRKSEFECPPEHIEALRSLLPKVDRLLVIGWRATEQNFIELLGAERSQRLRSALIACKSKKDSGGVWTQLEYAFQTRPTGFSNLENDIGFSDLAHRRGLLDGLLA